VRRKGFNLNRPQTEFVGRFRTPLKSSQCANIAALSRDNRRHIQVAAVLALIAAIVISGGALYFYNTINPVHTDPAAVPSTVAGTLVDGYSVSVEEARGLARALMVQENLPGLSVAVALDGEILWAESFGYSNVERRTPVTPHTRFRTGSVSKTLTAAAVALLYDRGRIDLDAPIQTYVPAYPQKQWTISTRQLLADVSGVHRPRGDSSDNLAYGHCTSLGETLNAFANEPLSFEPGTKYQFSTYGWVLLSAAVESTSGEPFSTFMSREVFKPLGMESTALEGSDDNEDIVSFYFPRAAMRPSLGLQAGPGADYSCFFGAGAFLSTPSDLVRLGSAMLKPGLLKAETIKLFQTPLQLESGDSTGFALGWKADTIELSGAPARVLRHRATPTGSTVSLSLFPDRKLAIAVTTNVTHGLTVDPFALQVAEAFAR
jgi:CubicO group peptidase (beta-lactamase class C family)